MEFTNKDRFHDSSTMNVPCLTCGEDFDILTAWLETSCLFACPECGVACLHSEALLRGAAIAREFLGKFGKHYLSVVEP